MISSYNYERFLGEAIESALQQTAPPVEVVVVDDGSTDNSRQVIAGFGSRVVPILKDNGGQASAWNAALSRVCADVVIFLDSDDVLMPFALEACLESFRDREIAKVHWPLRIVNGDGFATGRLMRPNLPEGDFRRQEMDSCLLFHGWPPTSGNAWSRRYLDRVFPIPESIFRTCPDLYLGVLAPLYGTIGKLTEPQTLWRRHARNALDMGSFEERLDLGLQRERYCMQALTVHCRQLGIEPQPEEWTKTAWWHNLKVVVDQIAQSVPEDATLILVDQDRWGIGSRFLGRRRLHLVERDGMYGGLPANDQTALEALQRQWRRGARFLAFVWPHLWWLDQWPLLGRHLRERHRLLTCNDRLVLFELSPSAHP